MPPLISAVWSPRFCCSQKSNESKENGEQRKGEAGSSNNLNLVDEELRGQATLFERERQETEANWEFDSKELCI